MGGRGLASLTTTNMVIAHFYRSSTLLASATTVLIFAGQLLSRPTINGVSSNLTMNWLPMNWQRGLTSLLSCSGRRSGPLRVGRGSALWVRHNTLSTGTCPHYACKHRVFRLHPQWVRHNAPSVGICPHHGCKHRGFRLHPQRGRLSLLASICPGMILATIGVTLSFRQCLGTVRQSACGRFGTSRTAIGVCGMAVLPTMPNSSRLVTRQLKRLILTQRCCLAG